MTMPIGKNRDQISPADIRKLIDASGLIALKIEYWKRGWVLVSEKKAEFLYNI